MLDRLEEDILGVRMTGQCFVLPREGELVAVMRELDVPVIREKAGKANYSLFMMGRLRKTMRELGLWQDCRMDTKWNLNYYHKMTKIR